MRLTLLAAALFGAAPAFALTLAQPVGCTLGDGCYIQHFVDRDAGPGVIDHACGNASYDAHDGTDFALPTMAAMLAGVPVLAAAPGRIRAVRDGEPDGAALAGQDVAGKECGNGVVIDHPDGWQTQYCHLRAGSVQVRPGETVAAGAPLGQIGASGLADFPHLHLTLRHNGAPVDPFRPVPGEACSAATGPGLWQTALPYAPAGLLDAGLAETPPSFAAVKDGLPAPSTLPKSAKSLVLWAYFWGTDAGDRLELEISGPAGFRFAQDVTLEKSQQLAFRYAGKRAPGEGFAPGLYSAEVRLTRAGKPLGLRRAQITLGP
ncbi:hypothetical protein LPB142_05150 [Rhodobacter xanthinilyticus]|uniref:M23ase beta-sheet core domain-containing protein n=1 Tax=Rhodobacter xanthinilyticus TaxID=1850250 RepID=A0A1D9MAB5_9RHOB|nr:M23 family metallopeptidase [Rhodobacter xanthinilyticus]AOZ68777.1 hypothetical protein LPB142_05150 [Rhodobacter xanthinilyticus]